MTFEQQQPKKRTTTTTTTNAKNMVVIQNLRILEGHVHLRIVKFESVGQQLAVTKKNLSVDCLNLEKSSFFNQKSKNYTFLPK